LTPLNTFSRRKIFRAALTMSRRYGVDRTTKQHIADHLGCAMSTVNHHWKTMAALRTAIVAHAMRRKDTVLLTGTIVRR
jgi:AcrR family transcriptional regulator